MFLEFAGIVFEFTPSASYIQKIRKLDCPSSSPSMKNPETLDYIDSTSYKNPEHTSYTSLIYNSKQRKPTTEKIRLNTKPNIYKLLCYFETNT